MFKVLFEKSTFNYNTKIVLIVIASFKINSFKVKFE